MLRVPAFGMAPKELVYDRAKGEFPHITIARVTGQTASQYTIPDVPSLNLTSGIGITVLPALQLASENNAVAMVKSILDTYMAKKHVLVAYTKSPAQAIARGWSEAELKKISTSHSFAVVGYRAATGTITLRNPWNIAGYDPATGWGVKVEISLKDFVKYFRGLAYQF